jgi:Rrf2 family protein
MQITRQADYALRAVKYLAHLAPGEKASTGAIAKEQRIPPSFLAKIISQLSIAGLIHTARGARGGVFLSRASSAISILDVVEAIDGPITMNECTTNPGTCSFSSDCVLHDLWCSTRDELVTKLKKTSFSQIA